MDWMPNYERKTLAEVEPGKLVIAPTGNGPIIALVTPQLPGTESKSLVSISTARCNLIDPRWVRGATVAELSRVRFSLPTDPSAIDPNAVAVNLPFGSLCLLDETLYIVASHAHHPNDSYPAPLPVSLRDGSVNTATVRGIGFTSWSLLMLGGDDKWQTVVRSEDVIQPQT